ncbi:MAG: prepilin-type N-terminal cleavage/methylation domain-containing protein [Planctomycetes bacterium]|nr:prepilin-type N-terminal cleavage/methylation domain-containing protein [Planctomycetota bacterium]
MPGSRAVRQQGFTLLEALVALAIVAMVVLSFLGIRTEALVDATRARNWRLAREIAEERLSELQAGAHETPPRSGDEVPLEKYDGFSYRIVIGESSVAEIESQLADAAAGEDGAAGERLEWQRDRELYRRASSQGLSYSEYQDKLLEDEQRRQLEERAPSETDFEEVAIVVYFPKLDPDYPDQKDSLLIKSRLCTLAIAGLTPEQAAAIAAAKGQAPAAGGGAPGGAAAGAAGRSGGTGAPAGGAGDGGK